MQDFRKLVVWQKAHQLALDVYRVTVAFPADEKYGLTGQLRRAATSIPTNIAEGCGRGSKAELGQFAQIAMGSASETEYLLLLTHDLGLLAQSDYDRMLGQTTEVKRMLASLIKKLKTNTD